MNTFAKESAQSVASLRGWCDAEIARGWAKRHFEGIDSRGNQVGDHQTQRDARCPLCREQCESDGR